LPLASRLCPQADGDNGIFESVAERLLLGDRLYSDVYDNKDPLFYYLLALQRAGGGWAQYLAELLIIGGIVALVTAIARHYSRLSQHESAVFIVAAAYAATGLFYWSGSPGTLGLLLTLASAWLASKGRWSASGACVGLAIFSNILFAPIALAFSAMLALARGEWRQRIMRLARIGAGLAVAAGLIFALLLARGEFAGYLDMFANTVRYTHENIMMPVSFAENLASHARTTLFYGVRPLMVAGTGTALLLVLARGNDVSEGYVAAARVTAALLAVVLVELCLVVIWEQQLAILQPVMLLELALLAPLALRRYGAKVALVATIVAVLAWTPFAKPGNPLKIARRIAPLDAVSPDTAALRQLAGVGPLSYARLGSNDDLHHALGTQGYRLLCADFHQYDFYRTARLRAILRCALSADFVIVHLPPPDPRWADLPVPPDVQVELLRRRWEAYRQAAFGSLMPGHLCIWREPGVGICRRTGRAERS
jgi:hypothetical protein